MDCLLAYAKINIFLEVGSKRSDGYHEIDTVMNRISLCDKLEVSIIEKGIHLTCNNKDIPTDENNLISRAAIKFFNITGINAGINVKLEKFIPIGAGLGGGSSDAASVFMYLCKKYDEPLSHAAKLEALTALGADVPYFAYKGCAHATGIGETLTYCPPLENIPAIVIPGKDKISTADAYKEIDSIARQQKENLLWKKLSAGNRRLQNWAPLCFNRFEDVSKYCRPTINALMDNGAVSAHLSGSGSSVFGLFSTIDARDRALSLLGGIPCELI